MKKQLAIVFFVTVIGSCGRIDKEGKPAAPQKPKPVISGKSLVVGDESLHALFLLYEQLSTALVNGEAAKATTTANSLHTGARELGWPQIASVAQEITTEESLGDKRTAFEQLGKIMEQSLRKKGLRSGAVYVHHCPMAFDNRGASWLSSGQETLNPYYGEEMLNCGAISDTLK